MHPAISVPGFIVEVWMDSNQRQRNLVIAGVAALFFFLCMGSLTLSGALGIYFYLQAGESQIASAQVIELPAPTVAPKGTPTPPSGRDEGAGSALLITDYFTEQSLAEVIIPTRDLRDLALRLRPGVDEIPEVVNEEEPNFEVGDRLDFWVSNVDDNRRFQITAQLIHKTDVAYAWVEVDQSYEGPKIARSVDQFSAVIYPAVREFFGSEWNPGVDNDPRLHILHSTDMGRGIAGYYSSADQFSRLANEFSNEKEIFYISLDWLNRSGDYTYYESVLAHEFQHMVHWYNDRNEETWVNEGLSELAVDVSGYRNNQSFANVYASRPDTQLNTWGRHAASNAEHYGASYLFMAYLLQRFGEEVTQAIVAHPANGITGITLALQETGHDLTFDEVFADWLVANYVDEPNAHDLTGVYGYEQLRAPRPVLDQYHQRYPVSTRSTTVHNYGADYIGLGGRGNVTVHFAGETETTLADVPPKGSGMMWWSNRADQSNSRLTRLFDFTDVEPGEELLLSAMIWYDIEDDYDYGYVVASRDGETWDILPGQFTTTVNPSGNSFGHGYTGISAEEGSSVAVWVEESFDLGDYAGEEVWLRFEYVTDDAINHPGWFIDHVSIPAIDYYDDFEDGAEGWQSEGWILTDNRLPQHWILQLILIERGRLAEVQRIPVDALGRATIEVPALRGNSEAILVISGATPVTTETAAYEYWIR
jgi:immune inhibitor A